MAKINSSKPVVLITGCSEGGIGYHLSLAYARQGYAVYATARRMEAMEGLREGGVKQCLVLDVTDKDSR